VDRTDSHVGSLDSQARGSQPCVLKRKLCSSRLSLRHSKQFINLITAEQQEVGMGLDSCTRDVNVVAATVGGKSIVVIDTPGIDNTRTDVKETDIFAKIATFLRTM